MVDIDVSQQVREIGEEFFADPHAYYRRWRADGPVHHVRVLGGVPSWLIIGYAEARAALGDSRLRKNFAEIREVLRAKDPRAADDSEYAALMGHMLNTDPPDHTRLRALVNKAFTPRRVAALRPRIEQITAGLVEAMAEHTELDLIREFAQPLPVAVICELLGVPFEDRAAFQAWTRVVTSDRAALEGRGRASGEMAEYLRHLIAVKHARPEEDLLSGLVRAREDGDRLDEGEVLSMAFLLLVAGHETTVNLIGNGVYALLRNRSQFEALCAEGASVPAGVEELLRFDGPAGWATVRYTAEPVSLGGIDIPAGEIVYIALAAADRDPARFDRADALDVTAEASGHLAFGYGAHYCVGAPLARLEAGIALTALLDRFPKLALAPGFTPEWQVSTLLRGMPALPVRLR